MNNASKDDELPFLELNEEIPAQWAIGAESAPQKAPQQNASSTPQVPSPARPLGDGTPARYSPFQSVTTQYGLTPTAKTMIGVGAVLVLLMITFRVPPGLVLIGLFSVLRVLFFPLAIVGFVLWAWRYRR